MMSWYCHIFPYQYRKTIYSQQDARDDVGGAEATGIKGFLVQTGKFKFQNQIASS